MKLCSNMPSFNIYKPVYIQTSQTTRVLQLADGRLVGGHAIYRVEMLLVYIIQTKSMAHALRHAKSRGIVCPCVEHADPDIQASFMDRVYKQDAAQAS